MASSVMRWLRISIRFKQHASLLSSALSKIRSSVSQRYIVFSGSRTIFETMSRYVLESAKDSVILNPATRKILRLYEFTLTELLGHGWAVALCATVQLEAQARLVEKRLQTSFRATLNSSF
jgi:hypothetical protein